MTFSWDDHEPTKTVDMKGPMLVTCKCGWRSVRSKGWAMDQFREHVSRLMPQHEEIKTSTLVKKVSAQHSTKRRWKR